MAHLSNLSFDRVEFGQRRFTQLWLVAGVLYGITDTVTTFILMSGQNGVQEANFLVRLVVARFGFLGMVAMKVTVIGILASAAIQLVKDGCTRVSLAQPAILTLFGFVATINNAALLTGVA